MSVFFVCVFGLWQCKRLELALASGVFGDAGANHKEVGVHVMLFIPKTTSIFSAPQFDRSSKL